MAEQPRIGVILELIDKLSGNLKKALKNVEVTVKKAGQLEVKLDVDTSAAQKGLSATGSTMKRFQKTVRQSTRSVERSFKKQNKQVKLTYLRLNRFGKLVNFVFYTLRRALYSTLWALLSFLGTSFQMVSIMNQWTDPLMDVVKQFGNWEGVLKEVINYQVAMAIAGIDSSKAMEVLNLTTASVTDTAIQLSGWLALINLSILKLKTVLVQALIPGLAWAAEFFVELASNQEVINAIREVGQGFSQFIISAVLWLRENWPVVIDLIKQFATWMVANSQSVMGFLNTIIGLLPGLQNLKSAFNSISSSLTPDKINEWKSVLTETPPVISTLVSNLQPLNEGLSILNQTTSTGKTVFVELGNALAELAVKGPILLRTFNMLTMQFQKWMIILSSLTAVASAFSIVIRGIQLAHMIRDAGGLVSMLGLLKTGFSSIIGLLTNPWTAAFAVALLAIKLLWDACPEFRQAVIGMFNKIVDAARGFAENIKKFFQRVVDAYNWLVGVVKGAVDAIRNAISAVKNALDWFGNILFGWARKTKQSTQAVTNSFQDMADNIALHSILPDLAHKVEYWTDRIVRQYDRIGGVPSNPNIDLPAAQQTSQNVNISITIPSVTLTGVDIEEFATRLTDEIAFNLMRRGALRWQRSR